MISKVRNNPEDIVVLTDVKKIGDSVRLNRDRISLTILGISTDSMEQTATRFTEYLLDGQITDDEKPSLQRDLDSLDRDYALLRRESLEANVGAAEEFLAFQDAYDKLSALLRKIINSVGSYSNPDVNDLNTYYVEYNETAKALGELILTTQSEEYLINLYYSRTKAVVNIVPVSVAVNTTTQVSASVLYNGEEKVGDVSVTAISFVVSGLTADAISDPDTYFTSTEVGFDVNILNNTAIITGCKTFSIGYGAIDDDGMKVDMNLTLDSDSMPF